MKTAIIGDVHGDWKHLDKVLQHAMADGITRFVQVGDFGYGWPGTKPWEPDPVHYAQYWLDPDEENTFIWKEDRWLPEFSFSWVDGNHECFNLLDVDQGSWQPDWVHWERATVKDFGSDGMWLGFGGASSIDKHHRVPHESWWPQEAITYAQGLRGMAAADQYDIRVCVSHEFPEGVDYYDPRLNAEWMKVIGAGDRQALRAVFDVALPDFWFFGHHHEFKSGVLENCKWACAPIISSGQYLTLDGDVVELVDAYNYRKKETLFTP